jgi:AmmeMemoRadiSam system protein B/AmmeMemoRadiSam system protein A
MTDRICRFAGSFFPAEKKALGAVVEAALDAARSAELGGDGSARAIIAAHAGYRYSGNFAALSYSAVGWTPVRVLVLSPSHRHAFRGLAFPSQARFLTPLGPVAIDRSACAGLAGAGLAHEEDAAHDNEHGIETQLPFIQWLWPEALLVPLVCGDVPASQVAQAVDFLAGEGTLVVLSSDLSHFLTREAARKKDAETAGWIETGNEHAITPHHACGAKGILGWLGSRAGRECRALRLGMGDSAAITGDTSRVVGYGAWAFYPIGKEMLNQRRRGELLRSARAALASRLGSDGGAGRAPDLVAAPLLTQAASFVTLTQAGKLRGCVGSLTAQRALANDVEANAIGAGLHDPRFPPVTGGELSGLALKIAVLSAPQPLRFASEAEALEQLVPGQDGLILNSAGRRGTFLPMVWDALPKPTAFLEGLKAKAGLYRTHWSTDLTLHRFRVESFSDDAAA